MFVGDINLGEYYTSFGHGPKTFAEHRNPFADVNDIFRHADFVVGNLEAPLTTMNFVKSEPESVVLRGNPSDARLLREAGFRVLQVANNHTVQHGAEGFEQTVSALRSYDIAPVGLAGQPLEKLSIGNTTIGFLAASDVPDNTDRNQEHYQVLDDHFLAHVKDAVQEVDHLFVLLHWGLEASTTAMDYQKTLAAKLADAGVRGVIGHHPHLFYEVTASENFVFAPSLGNFVFDLAWDERLLKSGILDITLDRDKVKAQLWPVELKHNGCLPSPTEAPVAVIDTVTLYDLGTSMEGEQLRKTLYFFKNIHRGNFLLKARFFLRKLIPALGPRKA